MELKQYIFLLLDINNGLLLNYGREEEHSGSAVLKTITYPCSYTEFCVGFCAVGCSLDGELPAVNTEGNSRVLCSLTTIKIQLNVLRNRSYYNWFTVGY